jgi:hypothetical protein
MTDVSLRLQRKEKAKLKAWPFRKEESEKKRRRILNLTIIDKAVQNKFYTKIGVSFSPEFSFGFLLPDARQDFHLYERRF